MAVMVLGVFVLAGNSRVADAQAIQPTDEQLRLINQLPPDQREQVLDALQQTQSEQGASELKRLSEAEAPAGAAEDETAGGVNRTVGSGLRASAGSRLVISIAPKGALSELEIRQIENDPVLRRLQGSQVFVLDNSGVLSLPGLGSIPLLGLTESGIQRRLAANPDFAQLDLTVRILDLQPTGVEALKPFGYDVFVSDEPGFEPPMTGPVPADYILGPGDTVRVQLFGNTNGIFEFDVTRDGILNLPEIGPVTVAGITFSEFRQDVNNRVREMLIGTQVSVTMGQLRTVRVFVLGDVNRPGSYIVGGLATVSSALYRSGGVSEVGSLRNIQLKRNGRTVTTLDVYDLLLVGDTSNDRRLQPGDVIFVPPVGDTIGVGGAVKRPAIYETTDGATLADAIEFAGGLSAEAFGAGARLERIDQDRERKVISVNLDTLASGQLHVEAGDILIVPEVLADFEDTVTLSGHVQRPGPYQWRPDMRLSDLIGSSDQLLEGVDANYVLIRRQTDRAAPVQALSADLSAALANQRGPEDIELNARDAVFVFSLAYGRQRVIAPLLEELGRQATYEQPFQQIGIAGSVRAPGVYPFEDGMRVSDLIRAGGGLAEMAYTLEADLTRYSVVGEEERATELISIDLERVLRGDVTADVLLNEHDHLRISAIPNWRSEWSVTIEGEILFPGAYRIRRGESLRQVLDRAGGITTEAFPEGAVFLRESLRRQEREQLQLLARRIEADLTSLSLESADAASAETLTTGQVLLEQLQNTEAMGRLVISPQLLSAASRDEVIETDIELMDGDTLLVPVRSQVVTVIGEVQQGTSHVYQSGLSRDEYIDMSGGTTRRADKRMIYVVRANGAVIAGSRSKWFARSERTDIHPGDTIVVPMEIDRIRPLTLWSSVTQILYQAAIAVAAVKTFDN